MAYSNSDLITYSNLSPNMNSPRNHSIDTVTIHCMAAQWTAKQCCDYFAKSSAKASSNYCVGKDGSIGLSVEEKNRSWCSSSASNDNRAITIEVASDTTHPYNVTDEAYNSLIDLLVDICKRNDIKKLLWKADSTLIGQIELQNMTVHRWFANKACPGDYLFNKHGEIADTVNARLTGSESTPTSSSDYAKYVWDYFMDKINNEKGVAGLMGNLHAESGVKPNNLQDSYESLLGYNDTTYTNAVNNGSYTEAQFVKDSAGYGLAQWTFYTRKQGLYDMWKSGSYSGIDDIKLACDFLYYELSTDYKGVLNVLKNATSIREASDVVLHDFESPEDQSESVEIKRENFAVYYYNKFSGSVDTSPDIDYEGIKHSKVNNMPFLLMAVMTDDL